MIANALDWGPTPCGPICGRGMPSLNPPSPGRPPIPGIPPAPIPPMPRICRSGLLYQTCVPRHAAAGQMRSACRPKRPPKASLQRKQSAQRRSMEGEGCARRHRRDRSVAPFLVQQAVLPSHRHRLHPLPEGTQPPPLRPASSFGRPFLRQMPEHRRDRRHARVGRRLPHLYLAAVASFIPF